MTVHGGTPAPREDATLAAFRREGVETSQELRDEQITAKNALLDYLKETVNPFPKLPKTEKSLDAQRARIQKMMKGEKGTGSSEQVKDQASRFQQRNPELRSSVLILLRERLKKDDSKEDILSKLAEFYPDVSLADEALEFLLATTDGELAKSVQEAKDEFTQLNGREIAAGRNIGTQAREAANKGLGTATSLRDMYRDITGNPRDSSALFQELSQRYAFKELKQVVDFMLHSLGADMKSKGPSIAPGQLHRLFTETRSLQAILGVYRFFRTRMGLMDRLFQKEGLQLPSQLNFETMAKQFMALASDRYPSSDKALQTAVKLGIEKWIMAKIIALSQFRDAIREVAVNQIYRSLQHRDDLYLAILEALEELEDELEELMEREEREREDQEEEEEEPEEEEEEEEE
ncbi:MAG: hypothetical protein H0X51_05410 [Parachlamydiaceae bacterium]|nr:hypothetical protein [Parachlamydiaceae bacterium]